jgi:hypothetical protein
MKFTHHNCRDLFSVPCDCGMPEHGIRFVWKDPDGPDDWFGGLWVESQLMQFDSFWHRLKIACKYLLRRECRFHYWMECKVPDEYAVALRDALNEKFPD